MHFPIPDSTVSNIHNYSNDVEGGSQQQIVLSGTVDVWEPLLSSLESMPRSSRSSPRTKRNAKVATVSVASSDINEEESYEVTSKKSRKNNHQFDEKNTTDVTSKGFKRHFASHNYHDFGRLRPTKTDLENTVKASKRDVHIPFPLVLHNLMEDAEIKGFANCISWRPHGRAFLIKDPKSLVEDILPSYFKHSKLSSFQRQLSLYGFTRLTSGGPDRGAYYHECFLRGRPFLSTRISRTRIKGTWVRTSASPELEPNFYLMESLPDLEKDVFCSDHSDGSDSTSTCTRGDCEQSISQIQEVPGSVGISLELPVCIQSTVVPLQRVEQQEFSMAASTRSPLIQPPQLPYFVVECQRLASKSQASRTFDNDNSVASVSASRASPAYKELRNHLDSNAHKGRLQADPITTVAPKYNMINDDEDAFENLLSSMDLDLDVDINDVYYQLLA